VRLNPSGSGLQWLSNDGDKEFILNQEPDSTPWLRIKLWLLSPFVPIEQL
jgi:putative cardiolipin synthase